MFFKDKKNINKEYYAEYLLNKHGKLGLTRQETACEIGISLSFLDKLLKEGIGLPLYKKIGRSKKPRIIFPIDAVAEFMIINQG